MSSLTDQVFIKAQRIRTLQQVGESKVDEGVRPELIGIINYAAMALVQLRLGVVDRAGGVVGRGGVSAGVGVVVAGAAGGVGGVAAEAG